MWMNVAAVGGFRWRCHGSGLVPESLERNLGRGSSTAQDMIPFMYVLYMAESQYALTGPHDVVRVAYALIHDTKASLLPVLPACL